MTVKIHYRDELVRTLYVDAGVQNDGAAGFDLVCANDIVFEAKEQFQLLDLWCHNQAAARTSLFTHAQFNV